MEEDFDFEKVSIKDTMEVDSTKIIILLCGFLGIQQCNAQAYSKLKRGFSNYMASGGELAYQQLCREITVEFNDCSKNSLKWSHYLKP
ncbi:hypothetical protein SESBI_17952 [Sesbania bispinosa]|nr:hypothetical protein SESBI_17952 [Sesbania bispinosa]